jgi:hypothetical protein
MGLPIPLLAVGLSAVGTGISALGAIKQGNALSAMSNYQAQVEANNAKIAAQYAENATQTGESQAYTQGLKERQQEEAVTAGLAAGNVDVNTGSAAQVRQSAREVGQLDVETVRQQAALQAYGYRVQQTGFQAQSQLETAQAGFESTAGWLAGAGTLASGAANITNFGLLTGAIPGAGGGDAGTFYTPGSSTPLATNQPQASTY